MDQVERAVMRALVCRGHYPETPDGFARAVVHAQDITDAFRSATPGEEEWDVGEAVYWSLYPDSDLPCEEYERFEADQDAVWDALAARPVRR